MFGNKPGLYFRRKGKGAAVYRVEENSTSHLNLQQIAMLKPNGEVKLQGKKSPTDDELQEIGKWYTQRQETLSQHDAFRVDECVSNLNEMAQWMQSEANDKQVSASAQELLMAVHDLRSTIVRRLAGKP